MLLVAADLTIRCGGSAPLTRSILGACADGRPISELFEEGSRAAAMALVRDALSVTLMRNQVPQHQCLISATKQPLDVALIPCITCASSDKLCAVVLGRSEFWDLHEFKGPEEEETPELEQVAQPIRALPGAVPVESSEELVEVHNSSPDAAVVLAAFLVDADPPSAGSEHPPSVGSSPPPREEADDSSRPKVVLSAERDSSVSLCDSVFNSPRSRAGHHALEEGARGCGDIVCDGDRGSVISVSSSSSRKHESDRGEASLLSYSSSSSQGERESGFSNLSDAAECHGRLRFLEKEVQVVLNARRDAETLTDVVWRDQGFTCRNCAKPPLPPGFLTAAEAHRAMLLARVKPKRASKPWEGEWTLLAACRPLVHRCLHRLLIRGTKVIDHMGNRWKLESLNQKIYLFGGLVETEGENILHRHTTQGKHFIYTRGDGGRDWSDSPTTPKEQPRTRSLNQLRRTLQRKNAGSLAQESEDISDSDSQASCSESEAPAPSRSLPPFLAQGC